MASSRRVRLCRAVAAALLSLLTLAASGSAPTAAASRTGNDVSWPQCSTSLGGYGLPMPSASAAFAVIGLNKGLPFAANPCLSSQVAWAASAHVPTQAYLIPAFPTAAQLSRYGADGPWAATSRSGRLANAGYAEA
ncbi:MAG TPA: hypothetical protein VHN80_16590, partial [Kineosporiaceae bacterium]|nr:hypothetical protein [Kineosporiaceae bacterium]